MKYLKFFVFSCLTASIFVSCNEISRISMLPLEKAAMLNESISFNITGDVSKSLNIYWNFGDGTTANGKAVEHVFTKAGIYHVKLYLEIGGDKIEQSSAIIRVHTPEGVGLPQVLLDTDARNEIDDQHYIAYALYSGIDVLAINSIHNCY